MSTTARTATAAVLVGRPAVTGWLEAHGQAVYAADPNATPYASPGWLSGWTAQLPARDEPLLLLARDPDGRPAALPLVRTPGSGALLCLVTALAGHEYVAPVGPGAQHPQVAAALADTLTGLATAGGVVLTLPYVPATCALGRELARRPHWSRIPTETAVVALPWDPAALPRSARRQHARRDRQHTDPDGPRITYRRTEPGDVDQLSAAAGVLDELHAARWPTRLTVPDWPAVLDHCADTASIAVLEADGRPIAAQLVLTRGADAWSALVGMDPGAAELSPGHALLRHLLRDLSARGYASLDLGPTVTGQREYKDQYGPEWGVSWHFLHTAAPAVPAQTPREYP